MVRFEEKELRITNKKRLDRLFNELRTLKEEEDKMREVQIYLEGMLERKL